jgi:hypothetical protein
MPMPNTTAGFARSLRMRALLADDHAEFWSAAGWRQRGDLSLVSVELGVATLN